MGGGAADDGESILGEASEGLGEAAPSSRGGGAGSRAWMNSNGGGGGVGRAAALDTEGSAGDGAKDGAGGSKAVGALSARAPSSAFRTISDAADAAGEKVAGAEEAPRAVKLSAEGDPRADKQLAEEATRALRQLEVAEEALAEEVALGAVALALGLLAGAAEAMAPPLHFGRWNASRRRATACFRSPLPPLASPLIPAPAVVDVVSSSSSPLGKARSTSSATGVDVRSGTTAP